MEKWKVLIIIFNLSFLKKLNKIKMLQSPTFKQKDVHNSLKKSL